MTMVKVSIIIVVSSMIIVTIITSMVYDGNMSK